MRNLLTCVLIVFVLAACGGKKTASATTANSRTAIAQASKMTDRKAKYNFLMNEGNGFLATGKYEDAAKVGEFMIEHVDPNDEATRRLIKSAYDKMTGMMAN